VPISARPDLGSSSPDDDKFLAAAVGAEARFVVAGDRDLLDLQQHRGVRIVRPGPFLRIVRSANPDRG
jgi:predicted nucleic acid-binding protein